ncbi:FecR family protein [Sphingomonas bacterium]|uniref:FecR family protein n=1 Tax=Sphingomonas bacterium TaxID=1895847 RepID=UPI0020C63238|nr:FecR domain-containing protein [Sphingomonas bacterium]
MRTDDMVIMDSGPRGQAIDWHLRQADLTEAQWLDFITWLESPANARAYDAVAAADRSLGDMPQPAIPATLVPANDVDPMPAHRMPVRGGARRWGWSVGGLAIAASLALLAMPMVRAPGAQPYSVETKAGERSEVALADGTRIELNGDTRIGLDHADPRIARLDRGEAVFHVTHDAAHPFSVRSGELTVQDVGTVFDLTRSGSQLDVAVAEGGVLFQPDGERVGLSAGQALSAREDTHQLVRSTVAADLVGGWRGGRLAFTGEPLGIVAAAIQRRYGIDVALESGLSHQSFTGMVAMSGSAERDIPHLAALIGAEWRHTGDQWILAPGNKPAR